ncbi:hypothetical protein [Burkholderia sp. AU32262]|uniref:hypothetical protein n=1 Tax=Burkholderia sp. AU32262 TaxID=2879630 RepID=UPI001CF27C27|nr:hypothetical protein [Burkholderia sp. AU32262]MCA8240611.1 hypothetical protein [Burkholderia sp. AU32262]
MTTNNYTETNAEVIEKALYCLQHGELESVENWLDLLRERHSNEKSPAPKRASGATHQRPETDRNLMEVDPAAECIVDTGDAGGNGTSSKLSHADAVTAKQALAAGAIEPTEPLFNSSGHSLTLTGAQLLEALDFIAPDRDRDQLESELTFQRGDGHAGSGMYCWLTEYPEEGAFFIDGATAAPAEVAPTPTSQADAQQGITIINSAYTHLLACTRCGAPATWTDEEIRQQSRDRTA